MNYDIVIIGGGIIGSSIAYHLARDERAGTIAVLERDNTYSKAATPRGSGGIRQLFSLPENIEPTHISLFDKSLQGIAFTNKPAFSFQGHPEASPGPHELEELFTKFNLMIESNAKKN